MARGRRVVVEDQKIKVRKYQYVTDKPDQQEVVKREIVTEQKQPGVLSNIFKRKRKPSSGTDRVQDFADTLERE